MGSVDRISANMTALKDDISKDIEIFNENKLLNYKLLPSNDPAFTERGGLDYDSMHQKYIEILANFKRYISEIFEYLNILNDKQLQATSRVKNLKEKRQELITEFIQQVLHPEFL